MEYSKSRIKDVKIEKKAITKVHDHEKQTTLGITSIWVGSVISIPMLMAGALLASGLTFWNTILVTLIAFIVQVFLMTLNGMQASDTGYPLSVLLGKTFGEKGSRYILSSVTLIVLILSYAIQAAVSGKAFSALLGVMGIDFPDWLSILLWGIIMLVTAVYGFGWMKILNYISVPFLVIVCFYAIKLVIQKTGIEGILNYQPENEMSFIAALSVMIGVFATGTLIVADITRYAKSRASTAISSAFGVIPAAILMVAAGSIMSIGVGNADISTVFVDLGLPLLGVLSLVIATWTTNTANAYMAGLALTRMLAFPDYRRPLLTLIVGAVGVFVALFNVEQSFEQIFSLLSTLIPPIAGIMIADYWIIGKGNPKKWGILPGYNYVGFLAWMSGIIIGFVPFFSPAFNSIIVGFVMYLVFYKILGKKLASADDPTKYIGMG